jgi:hypothetical protein
MTKDVKYPTEIKDIEIERLRKKFEEFRRQNEKEKEEFCECYDVCLKCGRKLKPWKDIMA